VICSARLREAEVRASVGRALEELAGPEIFYRVHVEKSGLTAEQQLYVADYGLAAGPWRK
jgi:hypothetical protein